MKELLLVSSLFRICSHPDDDLRKGRKKKKKTGLLPVYEDSDKCISERGREEKEAKEKRKKRKKKEGRKGSGVRASRYVHSDIVGVLKRKEKSQK